MVYPKKFAQYSVVLMKVKFKREHNWKYQFEVTNMVIRNHQNG